MPSSVRQLPLRSPKRGRLNQTGRTSWYPYYAGFSPLFVEDAITAARAVGVGSRILDPWNGSGTTTQVAYAMGTMADGFDLNPAMIIVARSKTLKSDVHGSLRSLLDEICSKSGKICDITADDPLRSWLSKRSASAIRSIEKAVFALLIDHREYVPVASLSDFRNVSALASLFYVAIFRCLRSLLSSFVGSNPTWVKRATSQEAVVNIPFSRILTLFREQVFLMRETLVEEKGTACNNRPLPTIGLADSSKLPVPDESYDLAISSPPYCTRIDYAVKTRPELAVLGVDGESFRALRDRMIGTPTVHDTPLIHSPEWGTTCRKTLDKIREHRSRASASYYWKTYIQYFHGLFLSLREISRALQSSGLCFLVLQDSFYKEVHVDLAKVSAEMAANLNLKLLQRTNFRADRTMVGINSVSRSYNTEHMLTESVLVLEKITARAYRRSGTAHG